MQHTKKKTVKESQHNKLDYNLTTTFSPRWYEMKMIKYSCLSAMGNDTYTLHSSVHHDNRYLLRRAVANSSSWILTHCKIHNYVHGDKE